ncbi:Zinc finger C2H2 [Penicillium malachiteum]|nr:Zinc finger C2H2 [Penicillium malachiteum]
MLLPLKKEMDNYYIFPKVKVIYGQPCILWETPMNGSTLNAQLRTSSKIHSFLNHFFSHQFRYRGGDLLNKSSFISKAQHNMIMAHTTSRTFIKHYRPHQHTGLQEIIYSLNPDKEFSKAITWMSYWINQQRPRYLSDANQESQVNLETQCAGHSYTPALRTMLEDQKRQVHNLRQRLQDKHRKETRRDFSQKQALTGGAVSDKPVCEVLRKEFEMPSEQILLVETFFTWPTTDLLEDEWTRRNKAVAAGIQYCGFQEGGPLWGQQKHSTPSDDDDVSPSPPAQKIKPNTPPTMLWEEGYTTSRIPILSTEQTFTYF